MDEFLLNRCDIVSRPSQGIPPVASTVDQIYCAACRLDYGYGPFGIDTERASGFRYSNRAYLIQIYRDGAGTILIDPTGHDHPHKVLAPIGEVLGHDEWILHAASQDLHCLREVGLVPSRLFDTELAARLAGFDRVNLATMVEQLVGKRLLKGHGHVDWSYRPLPQEWLNYAALDVEFLVHLRQALASILAHQGKIRWAQQEFEYVLDCSQQPLSPSRRHCWQRTSGIHTIRSVRQRKIIRELWRTRDMLARRLDYAPGRILSDSEMIVIARCDPQSFDELIGLPLFAGSARRYYCDQWFQALLLAHRSCEPLENLAGVSDTKPPPTNRWAKVRPSALKYLHAVRAQLGALAQQWSIPMDNLLAPHLVRRLCWEWKDSEGLTSGIASHYVDQILRRGQARPWQRELTVGPVTKALLS